MFDIPLLVKIATLVVLLVGVFVLFFVFDVQRRIHIGSQLIKQATPFEMKTENVTKTLLVVGDSAGVGVGAPSQESVAALLAGDIGATYVENRSVSGAKIEDVLRQLEQAERGQYDIILIQVGANNIVNRTEVDTAVKNLKVVFEAAQNKTDTIIHMSAGNVGAATAIPFFLRPLYHNLTLKYHAAFEELANELGVIYVNLYTSPEEDPFVENPKKYLARDGFHPSAAGYALWFEELKPALQQQ